MVLWTNEFSERRASRHWSQFLRPNTSSASSTPLLLSKNWDCAEASPEPCQEMLDGLCLDAGYVALAFQKWLTWVPASFVVDLENRRKHQQSRLRVNTIQTATLFVHFERLRYAYLGADVLLMLFRPITLIYHIR